MALNRKFNLTPDEDELDALREQYAILQRERDALQKQVKALQEKQKSPKPPKPLNPKKSSIFLIIAAWLVGARLLVYAVVEHSRPTDLGAALSWIFGVAVLCAMALWVFHDVATEGWLVAGPAIFLALAILICASIFDPVLLATGEPGPVEHPVIAGAILIACLLFAAGRVICLIMAWLLVFVTDPKEAFKQ